MANNQERIVVVTGGNRGIGLELVKQCAKSGDTAILTCRNEQSGLEAAKKINGDLIVKQLDVSSEDSINAFTNSLENDVDRIDVLINNAAIAYDSGETSVNTDYDLLDQAWATNVLGPWKLSTALVPMLERSRHPRIVNVSSEGGSLAAMGGGTPIYSVTKAALNALTRTMAGDLKSKGILVNAVCPGWTATDMGGSGGRPVSQGAASVMWAADLNDDGPTSTFTRDGKTVPW